MLRLTNTLSGKLEDFAPSDGSNVRMYVCGPTVHDFAHIGNFRTFVFEDVLRRHLRSKGWKVTEVMNITDVDDKIIQKAIAEGVDIRTYTEKYTASFLEDSDTLGIERPEILVRATDHISDMVDLVEKLIDRGFAYREGDSIYFRISTFPEYGRLARLDARELKAGARVEVDEYDKESPQDFVLWKAPKLEDEPRWETSIGTGRPGWHLECSAMAMKYLGTNIDIHCGGVDLVFPHHTNEIAQSECATGEPFVRFWVHAQHLRVEGQKMAKSLGNFFRLRDLLERGFSPMAIRYMFVSAPYSKPFNFTFAGLEQAARSIERIREFMFRLRSTTLPPLSEPAIGETLRASREKFETGLDDDLNTAVAMAALFDLIRAGNIALDKQELGVDVREEIESWVAQVDDRLGVIPKPEENEAGALDTGKEAEVEELIAARNEARRKRNFTRADEVRDELTAMGVVIEDTPEGTRWRFR